MIKHCKVCGVEYENCAVCEKRRSWRTLTDTPEHYYILNVLMDYKADHDAEAAYQALTKRGIDLFDTEGYVESIQTLMTEIYTLTHEDSNAQEDVEAQENIEALEAVSEGQS